MFDTYAAARWPSGPLTMHVQLLRLLFDGTGHQGNHAPHWKITGIDGRRRREAAPFILPPLWSRALCCIQVWISPAGFLDIFLSGCFRVFFFFCHLTRQRHVHHFTQVAFIVRRLKEPLRFQPSWRSSERAFYASEPGLLLMSQDKFISSGLDCRRCCRRRRYFSSSLCFCCRCFMLP